MGEVDNPSKEHGKDYVRAKCEIDEGNSGKCEIHERGGKCEVVDELDAKSDVDEDGDEPNQGVEQGPSNGVLKNKTRWILYLALLALFLLGLYRICFFSTYLDVYDAEISDLGGAVTMQVQTNAVLVYVITTDYWLNCKQNGKTLYLTIDENNDARDREADIMVYAGVLRDREAIIHVKQGGKGATYLKTKPESFDTFGNKGGTARLTILTDGDKWEIVSSPQWVTCSKEGNVLIVKVKENKGDHREGILKLESYSKSLTIPISQKEKPQVQSQFNNSGGWGGMANAVQKPSVNVSTAAPENSTKVYSASSGAFSSFMVVDRELSANEADAFLKSNPGWRFETRDELLSLYQNYEYALPHVGEGYWYYLGARQGGGYDLSSLAYNEQGKHDSNEYRNRVILVK